MQTDYKTIFKRVFCVLTLGLVWAIVGAVPVDASHNSCPFGNPCGPGRCTTWVFCHPAPSNFFCYVPITCPGGVITCGACPVTPPPLPGSPPAPPPSGGCVYSSPGPVTLNTPVNGAVLTSNTVTLSWNNIGTWGEGCPTVPVNAIYFQPDCVGGLTYMGSNPTINDLDWDRTYCWVIARGNYGPFTTYSPVWAFRTPRPPQIIASSFDAASINRCSGSAISGRSSFPTTNNPITYTMDVRDDRNDFAANRNYIKFVRIGVLAAGGFNYYPLGYADPYMYDPVGKLRGAFDVRNLDVFGGSPDTPEFRSINGAGGTFGAPATTGNLANTAGNLTLLGLNTVSTRVTVVDNRTLRVTWTVRFEDVQANGNIRLYGSVISQNADGSYVSQDADPSLTSFFGSDANYGYSAMANWAIDMNPPAASISVPTWTGTTTFNIDWQFSDPNGFRTIRSYCYLNSSGSATIRDIGLAQNIVLGTTPLDFPTPDQCLVNSVPRRGVHNYQVQSGTLGSATFKLYVQDNACNSATATDGIGNPNAWIMTNGNNVSAAGGFPNSVVQDIDPLILAAISPTIGNASYLATYVAITGNDDMPPDRQSEHDTYVTDYADGQLFPPPVSGQTQWYEFMYDLVSSQAVVTNTGLASISGNFSGGGAYNVPVSSTRFFRHTGNLTVQSNSTCNIKAIIFVQGNLTVNPDLNRTTGNGCMFVVNGNITIGNGTYKSAGLPVTASSLYDRVNAAFVTDGAFNTLLDWPGAGQLADALFLKGSITANTVSFKRDLGKASNYAQPAEAFEYDPFFITTFRVQLSSRKFSITSE